MKRALKKFFKCDFVTYKVAERGYNKHRNEKKLSFL